MVRGVLILSLLDSPQNSAILLEFGSLRGYFTTVIDTNFMTIGLTISTEMKATGNPME